MAQSPEAQSQVEAAHDPTSAFRRNLTRLNDWVRNGRSLSGRERNCCFLNLGTGEFATISALSGFDFDDDARSLALVDWDHDGDLDLWVANRTGPRLRFLRNESGSDHNFIALKLIGTRCNRDAIGARVEVVLHDKDRTQSLTNGASHSGRAPTGKLVRTLRAGEGYLGQSSKVVHFGLGGSESVAKVLVHWPGDENPEEFTSVRINSRHTLTQGGGTQTITESGPRALTLDSNMAVAPATTEHASIGLADSLVVPPLRYQDWEQHDQVLAWDSSRPTLINLWAAWCAPCAKELRNWNEQSERLAKQGIRVVGLALDEVDQQETTAADARQQFARLAPSFEGGLATRETLETLQAFHDFPFRQTIAMGVPTSFLVGTDGRLLAIYRGATEPERWFDDLSLVALTETERIAKVLPFAGRWFTPPRTLDPTPLVIQLAERKCWPEAAQVAQQHWPRMARNPAALDFLVWLGDQMLSNGHAPYGVQTLELAITAQPNHIGALNNLAWHYAVAAPAAERKGARAVELAERAERLTKGADTSILDTLAAAHAANSEFAAAVKVTQRAIEVARRHNDRASLKSLEDHLRLYQSGRPLP